ncbi:MAG: carbohydrate-binding domain-containing protein [Clostridia bacterium]
MKNKKTIIISLLIIFIIIAIVIFLQSIKNNDKSNYIAIDRESTNLQVEYSSSELTGEYSEYTAKITLDDEKTIIEGTGVTNNGNVITIKSAGAYYITGSISDGSILIEAEKNDEVQLLLDNASITSTTTAPINGVKASKLTITLAENSINTITDSSSYTNFTDTENSEPDGAIFTKTDLIINGNGNLKVNANYLDGIVSKDSLKIVNANIEVNSKDDAIRGKDYVAINNSNITINSQGDGIKSTNDTDTELGYIVIEGGMININSESDGVQAEKEITIESGEIKISSTDDSIHSNGIIIINGGNFNLSSLDDGIHADTNIVINNGAINIEKSYEGIESSYIEINGGDISLIASDDGINISGGNDQSSMSGRMGQNNFSQVGDSNQKLVINNGNIKVNSEGDGLDSNGSIYINGGTILVVGPTSSGNGALDYNTECIITAGDIVIYGNTGMWQNPSNTSTQYVLTFQISGKAGDEITLKDSKGTEITAFTSEKNYGAITISNSKIQKGETYYLYVNGASTEELTVDSIITSNSNTSGNGMQQKANGGGKR